MDPGKAQMAEVHARQEYWSGLELLLHGDLPDPGVKPASIVSPVSPTLADRFFTTGTTWEAQKNT